MKKSIIILIAIFGLCSSSFSQTRKQLEQKRKQKLLEIEQTKNYLKENGTKQKKSLYELQTISRQIEVREEIINTASGEIDLLGSEINYLETNIKKLEETLEALKKQYAVMIYEAYKNRGTNEKIAFVLSGKTFNENYQHLNYLQQIGKFSRKKAEEIIETQNRLSQRMEELTGTKKSKQELLQANSTQKAELESDKKTKSKMLSQLKGKESQMKKDLQVKEAQVKQLDKAIASAIAREIEEAKRKAEEEAKRKASGTAGKGETKSGSKNETYFNRNNTEAANALSADFEKNRKMLPWPVDKGYIIRPFGVHPHPTIPNVQTENNGVDIATTDGAIAKSIFKGEVRAVFPVPGMGTAVLVSHGDYYSVYCKLRTVNVSVGTKVNIGTAIGVVMKSDDDEKTELHLEIWKNTEKQNPELWLK